MMMALRCKSPLLRMMLLSSSSLPLSTAAAKGAVDVAIALGSNLGNRLQSIRRAIAEMVKEKSEENKSCVYIYMYVCMMCTRVWQESLGIHVVQHAQLYESAPMYVSRQPEFLNTAIRARTALEPIELLSALKVRSV